MHFLKHIILCRIRFQRLKHHSISLTKGCKLS
nr:MAG TPA: hypothetical protein [Bacteriophage sp.]